MPNHLKKFDLLTLANHREHLIIVTHRFILPLNVLFLLLRDVSKFSYIVCFQFKTQVNLVLAICILHNYILSGGEDTFIPSEVEWTPQQPPLQSSAMKERVESQEWVVYQEQITHDIWENK